jgi:glycosyltransferase involved in cell wall biosynthesis
MTPRYRIAMIAACPFPCPRGTPVRIHRMAEALHGRGHEVHVFTYALGTRNAELPFAVHRAPDLPTYRRLAPGPSYQKLLVLDPLLAHRAWRALRRQPVDVIHGHHYEGLLIGMLLRRSGRCPLVYDAHTMLESELPDYRLGLFRGAKRRLGRALDRSLPRRADHVIAVTSTIRDKLSLEADRVSVVPNGVEYDLFQVAEDATGRPGGERLIFTGNLAPYQGVDLLLRAFGRVRATRPRARLALVTDSRFEPYRPLARELGLMDGIDLVPADFARLPRHLAEADVAVSPRTVCDGIPQKLLNYMAAGKPIVAFAGSAKTIRDGETGLVVEDGDVSGLAAAIVRLLGDAALARRLGESARRFVARHHAWSRTAEQVEEVYGKLLGDRRASPRALSCTA